MKKINLLMTAIFIGSYIYAQDAVANAFDDHTVKEL